MSDEATAAAAFLEDCWDVDEDDEGADEEDAADEDDVKDDDAGWRRSVATEAAEMGAAFLTLPLPTPLSGDLESRMRVP